MKWLPLIHYNTENTWLTMCKLFFTKRKIHWLFLLINLKQQKHYYFHKHKNHSSFSSKYQKNKIHKEIYSSPFWKSAKCVFGQIEACDKVKTTSSWFKLKVNMNHYFTKKKKCICRALLLGGGVLWETEIESINKIVIMNIFKKRKRNDFLMMLRMKKPEIWLPHLISSNAIMWCWLSL